METCERKEIKLYIVSEWEWNAAILCRRIMLRTKPTWDYKSLYSNEPLATIIYIIMNFRLLPKNFNLLLHVVISSSLPYEPSYIILVSQSIKVSVTCPYYSKPMQASNVSDYDKFRSAS